MQAEPKHAMDLRLTRQWRTRGLFVLGLIVLHLTFFYGFAQNHARSANSNDPPMFGPVVSQVWREVRQRPLTSKEWTSESTRDLTPPSHRWRFSSIDIWPAERQWNDPTSFTPVTDAEPDPPDTPVTTQDTAHAKRAAVDHAKLRMIRWVRPAYPMQWAQAGLEGAVQLDLRVDPRGFPIEVRLTQRSGSQQLDEATLQAAHQWRFAPPQWKSESFEVWARLQVQYHCCE